MVVTSNLKTISSLFKEIYTDSFNALLNPIKIVTKRKTTKVSYQLWFIIAGNKIDNVDLFVWKS